MSALDGLTVCLTTFRRPDALRRCIDSIQKAGVRNFVVCDGSQYGGDVGCNNTWMIAAYRAKTKRVILMHDDDELSPEFGRVYEEVISPALDKREAGFVSWNASLKYPDGTIKPCPYWEDPSTLMPSHHLLKVVDRPGTLSLSPVVSVFNRTVLIRACKEAGETLTHNDCLLRPGMLLGTEILAYMRHIQAFKRWLYLDKVLSFYGAGDDSGTVKAQRLGQEETLTKGYDLARDQGRYTGYRPTPRILLVYSDYDPKDEATKARQMAADASWEFHLNNADMVEVPYKSDDLPKIRAILDYACSQALSEDIVLYANADAGLTTHAVERIIEGVHKGHGVTCCLTHELDPVPGVLYKNVSNCKTTGGIDMVAMTPAWWKIHRDQMPDMFIGREAWDNCFCELAKEWSPLNHTTKNVCWHQDHDAPWRDQRLSDTQRHNRELAKAFFAERGNPKSN